MFGTGLTCRHGRFTADCKNGCLSASSVVIRFEDWTFSIFDSRSNAWSPLFNFRPGIADCSAFAAHPVLFPCRIPPPYPSLVSPISRISELPTMHPISFRCIASQSFPFICFSCRDRMLGLPVMRESRIIPALQTSTAAVCFFFANQNFRCSEFSGPASFSDKTLGSSFC